MEALSDTIAQSNELFSNYGFMCPKFSAIYPFPTENVADCLSSYDFKDKNCLTVLGSSAQLLYMYLNGASNVTSFDVNYKCLYFFYFVKAFIESNLNPEDLVNLMTTNDNNEKARIYKAISSHLYGDAKKYWDTLYSTYGTDVFDLMKLFFSIECKISDIYKNSGYLNKESLSELRKMSDTLNPNFIHTNITDLHSHLESTYDMMYFSNIMQYSDFIFPFCSKKNSLIKYKDLLMNLTKYLSDNGQMYCGYLYEYSFGEVCVPISWINIDNRKDIFSGPNYSFNKFPAFDPPCEGGFDACLIYKK